MERRPPAIQTSEATPTELWVWRRISAGTRKMPEPMTAPTMSMTRSWRRRVRRSWAMGGGMMAQKLGLCPYKFGGECVADGFGGEPGCCSLADEDRGNQD